MLRIKGRRGSAVADVLIFAAIVVFVLLPIFSIVMEKYLILNKVQIIRDAADMAGISVYHALNASQLGKAGVDVRGSEAEAVYRQILAENLRLDSDLKPLPGSVAEDAVTIRSLRIYSHGFPDLCPQGTSITRPSVHSVILVPLKPSLYRGIVLNMLGKQYVELEVHMDSDIPVNN